MKHPLPIPAPRFLRVVFVFLAWFLSGLAVNAQSTGTITGRVYNPATKEFVRDAEVRIEGTGLLTATGDGGYGNWVFGVRGEF